MVRHLGAWTNHIPLWSRPLALGILVLAWVMLLGRIRSEIVRSILRGFASDRTFIAMAKRYGTFRGWLKLEATRYWRGNTRFDRAANLAMLIVFAAFWAVISLIFVILALEVVGLGQSASGPGNRTHNGAPLFFYVTWAGYTISPLIQLGWGANQIVACQTEYFYRPIGIRGRYWEWAKQRHRKRSASGDPRDRSPSPMVKIQWPNELLNPDSARLAVVRALAPHVGSAASGFLLGTVAMTYYVTRHQLVTQSDDQLYTIELLLLAATALLFATLSIYRMPLIVRAQLLLLWCCQSRSEPIRGGLQDPLGSLRPGLIRSQQLLTKLARQLERHSSATGTLPTAVILRALAKNIRIFTEGKRSLNGDVPTELKELMLHIVAVLAGPRQPDALRVLAEELKAFDSEGRPHEDLVVQAGNAVSRVLARLSAAIAGTATFIRGLTLIVLMIGTWWLFVHHKLGFSGIAPNFK